MIRRFARTEAITHGRGDDVDRRPELADHVGHGRREQDDLDEQAGDHHPAEAEPQGRETGRTAAEEEPEGEPDRDGVEDEHQVLWASVLCVGFMPTPVRP